MPIYNNPEIAMMKTLTQTLFFQMLAKISTEYIPTGIELDTHFYDFTQAVTTVCDQTDKKTALRILNYTRIKLWTLRKHFTTLSLPKYIINSISEAEQFIDAEIKIFGCIFQYPEHFALKESTISSPLYWSKAYSAISVSEILCGLERMAPPPFVLADGSAAPFNLVVRVFEDTLHIKLGDPSDVKRRVLERKKERTKFTEALLYTLNKEDE